LLLVLIVGARPAVQALFNLRLPNPDDYVQLRTSHELLAGSWSGLLAPPVAVLTAMVARLAASDPMQVLRFLRPILYVSCAAAAASLVKRLTRQPELGWCVGVIAALYLETPFFDLGMTRAVLVPSSNDLLAVSALLVGLALFFDDRRPQMAPWEAWATLMIAEAGAPFVAALAFGGAVVVTTVPVRVAAPSLGAVLFIAGLAIGPLGQGALPAFGVYFVLVGAGLILAYVARSAVSALRRYARLVTGGVHPLVVVPGIFVLANPFGMPTLYLEHDATARQTVTLAHAHKGSPWVLVGAPEQEIEIGNDGEFEDLQQFVLRYGSRVSDPGFRFDIPVRRIFVQVERRPFRDEAVERLWSPSYAANSQWAAYRLRARRESLHQAALALCESYRRTHFGVSIIYEDDDLRVYAIDRTSTTGAAP
jgi:hypothetical protein